MTRILIAIILSSSFLAQAEEVLWKDNKLTPAQPFPGRVLAVESGWGGYRLIIESIGDGDKKYCIAQVWPGGVPPLDYKEIGKNDLPPPGVMMVFLNPSIEVDRFHWSMGPLKIGKIFGDEDCLKKVISMELERQNHGSEPGAAEPGKDVLIVMQSPPTSVNSAWTEYHDKYRGNSGGEAKWNELSAYAKAFWEVERAIEGGQSISEYPGILAHGSTTWDPSTRTYSLVLGLRPFDAGDGLGQFSVTFDLTGKITAKKKFTYKW